MRDAVRRDHVARPVASEVRTFPTHGAPPVIFTCPATSSFAPGVSIPIPILPADHAIYVAVLLPSCIDHFVASCMPNIPTVFAMLTSLKFASSHPWK